MPATFPSHQAVVLPLKLWRPRWFDGVALCTGAAAPDAIYAVETFGLWTPTHNISALFWWSVPVSLASARLIRWAAPAVARHLPGGGILHVRDYAVLGRVRYRWWVSAVSALIGAVSHLLADLGTHGDALRWTRAHGIPGWEYAQAVSSLLLALGAVATAVHIGRHRLLVRWHGGADLPPPRYLRFWGVFVAAAGPLLVLSRLLPGGQYNHVLGVRLLWAVALAFLAAAAATRPRGKGSAARGRASGASASSSAPGPARAEASASGTV